MSEFLLGSLHANNSGRNLSIVILKILPTLLEKVFFLSFGFRFSTETGSEMLLFQAQIMICS
jgi:hypothetical protein